MGSVKKEFVHIQLSKQEIDLTNEMIGGFESVVFKAQDKYKTTMVNPKPSAFKAMLNKALASVIDGYGNDRMQHLFLINKEVEALNEKSSLQT